MPVDQSDPYLRLAIWQAYDKRCLYCGRLVEYDAFQIDHVIPRFIFENAERLARFQAAADLSAGFEFLGLENLVMSCRRCNTLKSGGPQEDGDLRYTLRRAANMLPKIMARITTTETAMGPPTAEQLANEPRELPPINPSSSSKEPT